MTSPQWQDPNYPPPSAPPAPTYPSYQTPPAGQYGAAPVYSQPQVPYPAPRQTNPMALAAMIVSLAGLVTCIAFPVGAILGHFALKQVRQTGEQGEGFAKTGIIVGWIGTALAIVGCVAYIALVGWIVNEGVNNTDPYGY